MDVAISVSQALRRIGVIAVIQCLSACYPHPHEYTSHPEISGVLFKSGVAVGGANVIVAHSRGDDGNYCLGGQAVAVTGEAGTFHIEPQVERYVLRSLLNPPNSVLQMTSVCFETDAKVTLGVLLIASTERTTSYDISCDLDATPTEFKGLGKQADNEFGICKNTRPQ